MRSESEVTARAETPEKNWWKAGARLDAGV
jgi:hypothetical protein